MTTDADDKESRPGARDPLGLDDEPEGAAEPPADEVPPRAAAGSGPAPSRPRGGRLLGTLALLLALASAGGAGYLYYELIYLEDTAEDAAAGRIEALETELAAVDARFERMAARQQEARAEALAELRRRQAAARQATEAALREALAEVARAAPPDTGEWRRAEVRYLLRIANHRLLMERDVAGALRLLRVADGVLAEIDDFALHEVRARLSDEIAALEGVSRTDLQGLFLRLESAKQELDALPLRKPRFTGETATREPSAAADEAEASDPWAALQRQLSGLVRVRELDGTVKPLLAPEESIYLELNLRLMLERAQLAAVRGEQLLFDESLATAIDWIDEYLNVAEPPVQRLRRELAELAGVDLERPLPDISGSLQAMRNALEAES